MDWVANLRTQRHAAVWIDRRRRTVAVTLLDGGAEENARRSAHTLWPETAWFERLAGRPLPCFRLDPVT